MLNFTKGSLVCAPKGEIRFYDPEPEGFLSDEIPLDRAKRVMCSIVDFDRRSKWVEFFEFSAGEEPKGIIAVNEEWILIYLFVGLDAFQNIASKMPSIWSANARIEIDIIPDPDSRLAKGREVYGIGVEPWLTITNSDRS